MKSTLTIVIALLATVPMAAQAVPILNASDGLDAPDVIIDFGTLPGGTAVSTEFAGDGLTFDGPFVSQNLCVTTVVGPCLNSSDNSLATIYGLDFDTAISEFALQLLTNSGTTTFTALLGGAVVETFAATTNRDTTADDYYGFEDIVFDEVRFQISAINSNFNLDNVQYSFAATAVPEPGTLALLTIGLLGIGVLRRRRLT